MKVCADLLNVIDPIIKENVVTTKRRQTGNVIGQAKPDWRRLARQFRRRCGVFLKPRLRREVKGEGGFACFAHGYVGVNHLSIINHFATLRETKSYLEIGVRSRESNLDQVLVNKCVGVDPNPAAGADFVMTSDEFFEKECSQEFDLIFIDGLHTGEQVARDIQNSLAVLSPNGTIILHDLNPPTAEIARPLGTDSHVASWCGTSWKGFVHFRANRRDLEMYVVDTDWGCGVIRRGNQDLYVGPYNEYNDLDQNRNFALNLISVEEFLRKVPVTLNRKLSILILGR